MKIKRILVSQEKPSNEKSPYEDLALKNDLEVIFNPFIKTESIKTEEFRKTRIKIDEYTSLIFTNKTSVDYYFNLCAELRIPIKNDLKYFCASKSIANYLQKYIMYRKRRILFDEEKTGIKELFPFFQKFQDDNYLLPVSNTFPGMLPNFLKKNKLKFTKFVLYRTVNCDLSEIKNENFDMIVFYSPNSVNSLLVNFPDFKQKNIIFASFGTTTAKAIKKAGFKLAIEAPSANAPSMSMAIDLYLKKIQNHIYDK